METLDKRYWELLNRLEDLEDEVKLLNEENDRLTKNIEQIEDFLIPDKYRIGYSLPNSSLESQNFYVTKRRKGSGRPSGLPETYPPSKEERNACLQRMKQLATESGKEFH